MLCFIIRYVSDARPTLINLCDVQVQLFTSRQILPGSHLSCFSKHYQGNCFFQVRHVPHIPLRLTYAFALEIDPSFR